MTRRNESENTMSKNSKSNELLTTSTRSRKCANCGKAKNIILLSNEEWYCEKHYEAAIRGLPENEDYIAAENGNGEIVASHGFRFVKAKPDQITMTLTAPRLESADVDLRADGQPTVFVDGAEWHGSGDVTVHGSLLEI